MIQIYIQSTHCKFYFETDKEKEKANKILNVKFKAKDKNLERDPRVLNGTMDAYENFYNEEYSILPVGLLPYLLIYFDKEKIEYELVDLRKFPSIDKEFAQKLINNEIVYYGKEGTEYENKKYEPRDYQKEAILTVVKRKGGIIKLPTASGKGYISALLCRIYSKHKILFIFNRIDLIHQTYNELIEKYEFEPKDISLFQGDNIKKDGRIILLSDKSYEKAYHLFPNVKVIVSDECHINGRTETARKIIYSCQNAPVHIGLSATPDYIDNPAEQMRLYSVIGPIVYSKEIIEQIDGKVLSDVIVKLIKFNLNEEECPLVCGSYVDQYEKYPVNKTMIKQYAKDHNLKFKDCREEDLIDAIVNEWVSAGEDYDTITEKGDLILRKFKCYGDESTHYVYNIKRNELIAQIAKKHKRVLILFTRTEHGEELKKLLPEAIMISGKSSMKERKKAEMFLKENENAIVLASNIWSTGKDIPEIETFINASGGVSQIQQIQKMGRALRISNNTGKEIAIVYDFKDEFSPLAIKQSNIRERTYNELKINVEYI